MGFFGFLGYGYARRLPPLFRCVAASSADASAACDASIPRPDSEAVCADAIVPSSCRSRPLRGCRPPARSCRRAGNAARFHRAGGRHGGDFPLPPYRPFRTTGIRSPCPFRCPYPPGRLTSTGRASLRTRASVLTAARVRPQPRAGDQPALF